MARLVKGTRDHHPNDIAVRNSLFNTIESIFESFGAVPIDTPVFEHADILKNKYGEDSKLIYELNDQNGQHLALRYDLTVPFARYVATNNVTKMKRYQIGKVYRRDQPSISHGRLREFYQCDFDIAGDYKTHIADAECLQIINEILNKLNLGTFYIKVSHRALLDSMLEMSGVPEDKLRTIGSAIDKLDKETWENVKQEMLKKGLSSECADKIKEYIQIKGSFSEIITTLNDKLTSPKAKQAISEINEIMSYCELAGCTKSMIIDLSLARGLDYYTGLIYEACVSGTNVGTIIGGGRYDNLIGAFTNKKIPAVGFSIGIERVLTILSKVKIAKPQSIRILCKTQANISDGILLSNILRKNIITILDPEYYTTSRCLKNKLINADEDGITYVCLLGESDKIIIKNMVLRTQEEYNDIIQASHFSLS